MWLSSSDGESEVAVIFNAPSIFILLNKDINFFFFPQEISKIYHKI